MLCINREHKSNCDTKILHYMCKIVWYIFIKKQWFLEFFLTPILPNKIMPAVKLKFATLGTLGMPGQAHSKCWCKHVENSSVYLHRKYRFHHSFLSEDTVKMVPTCLMTYFPKIKLHDFKKVAIWEKILYHGQIFYKAKACNLWFSHEEREILTYVKHFCIIYMHIMFTSNSSKFLKTSQCFYKSLTWKLVFFP